MISVFSIAHTFGDEACWKEGRGGGSGKGDHLSLRQPEFTFKEHHNSHSRNTTVKVCTARRPLPNAFCRERLGIFQAIPLTIQTILNSHNPMFHSSPIPQAT